MYRWLRQVHLWITLVTGLPLLVLSVTGALLVFGPELEKVVSPAAWTVTPEAETLGYGTMLERVQAQRPGARPWAVVIPERPDEAWKIWLTGGKGVINFDPYTGDVLKSYDPHSTLNGMIVALHRWWLVPGGEGRYWTRQIISVAALLMMVSVLAGLALWLIPPRPFRRLAAPTGRGAGAVVMYLHLLFGVVTAVLMLLIAFTGLSLHWHDSTRAVVEAALPGTVDRERPPRGRGTGLAPGADLDAAIAVGRGAFPGARLQSFRPPDGPDKPLVVTFQNTEGYKPHTAWVGGAPPRVLKAVDGSQLSPAGQAWHMRYQLHVGSFAGDGPAGIAVRILWIVLSLMPAAFTGTGLWLYWRREWRPVGLMVPASR